MSGSADDVLSRIVAWAAARPDIAALVQIGSRVQPGATPDAWSDYDFHLITSRPRDYRNPAVLRSIGDSWLVSAQPVFGNATKLTVILAGAAEVDFIVLPAWQMRVVFGVLRFPSTERAWPAPLRAGVRDLRIIACPGWQLVHGSAAWEHRYRRLGAAVPWPALAHKDFHGHVAGFWAAAIWTAKKIARGESRAAQREINRVLVEKLWLLLEAEARSVGGAVRPEARHAEIWLAADRRRDTDIATRPEAATLRRALGELAQAFSAATDRVAARHGWTPPPIDAAREWVLQQCRD